MHRTLRISLLATGVLFAAANSLAAQSFQSLAPQRSAEEPLTTPAGAPLLSPGALAQMGPATATSALDRVGQAAIYTAGFALVGGGIGYFASQVAYSDWDKETDSTFAPERRAFSISGAAIGGALGMVLGLRTRSGPIPVDVPIYQELAGRDVIVRQEVAEAGFTTAYDAIQALRPNWLVVRGVRPGTGAIPVMDGDRIAGVIEAIPTLKVYRDNAFLGGVDSLRDIPISVIGQIRRLSAAEATNRWGAGHLEGALLVESAPN